MLIVKKFGGSSVADAERVMHVAKSLAKAANEGHRLVVVLSAQGKTTDSLIAKAHELSDAPSKREMDMLLATGEQQSVALMAIALEKLGIPAVSLNAFQVAMHTNRTYSSARLQTIDTVRINDELDQGKIVLVTGFQGVNRYDDLTTLGRGGSDTTAVAIAAAMNADRCQIYTDVEGVYTADPRVVPNARKLSEIGYSEMLELASTGAKVLHNRCVELARKYKVEIEVLSSMTEAPGTIVKEDSKVERMLVSGVSADKKVSLFSIIGIKDEPGLAFELFSRLARNNINIDIILQSIGRDGTKDISFTVSSDDMEDALQVVKTYCEEVHAQSYYHNDDVAKVSVVGAGMTSNPGIASKMFEALYNAHINIQMISTSEVKISVLIARADIDIAVKAIHDQFKLYEG